MKKDLNYNQAGLKINSHSAIDLDPVLKRLGGDESLMRDMAVFYLEDVPQLLSDLESAITHNDLETLVRSAHSIKGLSANFNATQAENTARSMEADGKRADVESVKAQLPQLQSEIEEVMAALRQQVLHS